ncbi:hypothetical protein VST7929_02182 [Vibrio stylophorae]|uniref:Lipoprotein n=1 Tax=Vibrio stylophorae TaxID=659351 RepID=A0ABN8DW92_9VIBR|nr:hypothetical protein [Vibrio stylophorae]CAH0534266.1 hypothetical protein VST7929_02182 [Vibrio stylophorae]
MKRQGWLLSTLLLIGCGGSLEDEFMHESVQIRSEMKFVAMGSTYLKRCRQEITRDERNSMAMGMTIAYAGAVQQIGQAQADAYVEGLESYYNQHFAKATCPQLYVQFKQKKY